MAGHEPLLTTGLVASIGLSSDLIGAFFLAKGLTVKRAERIAREASDPWGGNPWRLRGAMEQRLEAWTGFGFLALGFTGQFLSTTDAFRSGPSRVVPVVVAVGVFVFVVAWFVVSRFASAAGRRASARVFGPQIADRLGDDKLAKSAEGGLVKWYAAAIGVEPLPGEESEDLGLRVRAESQRLRGNWWAALRRPEP